MTAEYVAEVRNRDQIPQARFRRPILGPIEAVEHEVGTASVAWDPDVEEAVAQYLLDPVTTEHLDWLTSNLELWVWRNRTLVHRGPIVGGTFDADSGLMTTESWDSTGYLWLLDQGRGKRYNYMPDGEFSTGFPGWSSTGATGKTEVTGYRGGVGMRLKSPTDAYEEALSEVIPAAAGTRVAHLEIPIAFTETPPEDAPLPRAAVVIHEIDFGGWVPVRFFEMRVSGEATPGVDEWNIITYPRRLVRAVDNRFRVRLSANPTETIIGGVEIAQAENVSALAGDDVTAFAAALGSRLTTVYLVGWTSVVVAPLGVALDMNWREDDHHHAPIRDLLSKLEKWGVRWRVVAGETGYPEIQFAPSFDVAVPELRITPETATGLQVVTDSTDGCNEALTLSNGADAPTRDEGFSSDVGDGAVLMRTEMAPDDTAPNNLDTLAETVRLANGRRRTWTAQPATGPRESGIRDLPGGWVELVGVGSLLDARATSRRRRYDRAGTLRVTRRTLTPADDSFACEWDAVA